MTGQNTVLGKSVRLDAIRKSYGTTTVLRDLSLDIPAGCFCTLLGSSGSGKSTLLKLIAGFETPDAGVIRIGGNDVGKVPVNRRNIGMVFQNYALFPHMSVRHNVSFGLDMRRISPSESARRVDEALEMVGLDDLADRRPRDLSGGQQQRVALARALVIRPDILLMDEPLGALDRALRQTLQVQIRVIQKELGITVIFVTHDQEEALHMSDQIVLMRQGAIEQAGSPWELYRQPKNRFVASFLDECNYVELPSGPAGIRPARLRLGADARTQDHVMSGRVERVTFLGANMRVTARVGQADVVALVPTENEPDRFSVGQLVEIGFADADVMPIA
ncbi:ABC transporter ATP-binding protein [Gluconacetobacter azotocaptans]|uniref:ABC transporter ATP-binding protein n=1 Tax=Gluconacetobacter azotocaptans TaxID=142834 RepID=UPI00195BD57D|nr:ABC transporter ATP-binding protein [Gluconacetobacter azotocaptans]MBM9400680.1 ABC transporter ATP-binding protein [Gluconacetobacter azotocaptans]